MMKFKEFQVEEGEPAPEDFAVIDKGLKEHHKSKGKVRNPQKFSIFLRTEDGEVFGGIIGTTFWGRMYINSIWVHESLRGRGWGRKLMQAAEAEAIRRGCTAVHTDTFSWQSPDFYQSLGYEVFGVLEDYPPGNKKYYVTKKLVNK
jgi:ribosomal protein S18 acetylase RimI-like enzyme